MQTRWHTDDLIGRLLEEDVWVDYFDYIKNGLGDAKWVRLRLPAIADKDELYRKADDALWPDRYDLTELEDIKKSLGPYEWTALYQQNPISSEHQEFKKSWFASISHTELEDVEQRHRFLTVDTAVSQSNSADYTGFVDNIVDTEGMWHLRAWKHRLAPHVLIEELFRLHLENNYTRIGIEETIYSMVLRPFLEEEMRKREIYLPIVPLKHKSTQKNVRIRSLIPRYAAGGIRHVEGECTELEFELLTFPNGKHDDVGDAAAYQTQIMEDMPKDESTVKDFYETLATRPKNRASSKAGLR